MARQPEGKIVRRIQDYLQGEGVRAFKIHGSDEGFQEVGIPDLLCSVQGRFVGIEVKQPGEGLRSRQRVVLREIFDAGGVAAVVETVGQVARLLSTIEKESDSEKASGLCFNRGLSRRDRCAFD